jgi:Ca2+/H+ antiporter
MRYVYSEASSASSHQDKAAISGLTQSDTGGHPHAMAKAIGFVVIGLLGLVFGWEFIVVGASGIARNIGMSERVIGLVIVGPGTSVPELIASIAAARRKDVGMVMGNVLGTNIFNIFFTLGATAIVMPVTLDLALNTVVIINIAVTALLVGYVTLSKSKTLGRPMGALLVAIYAGYIVNSLMSWTDEFKWRNIFLGIIKRRFTPCTKWSGITYSEYLRKQTGKSVAKTVQQKCSLLIEVHCEGKWKSWRYKSHNFVNLPLMAS